MSKSAVSKRITQLEARLGAQLLHRSTRKLSLTEAGEHYYKHAVEALRAARDAEDAVSALQGAPRGRLRLNTPMSFGKLHIAPLMSEFLSRYPGLEVDMLLNDKVVDLVDEGLDLAIRGGNLGSSTLIARKLAPLHSVLCASPSYLEQKKMPSTPAELGEHNCLHFTYSADNQEWTFVASTGNIKVRPVGNFRINNSEALREVVLGGAGIARLPTFIAGPDLVAGKLRRVLGDFPMKQQTLYAAFPDRRHLPAKVRVFIDFVVEKIGGDDPHWNAGLLNL